MRIVRLAARGDGVAEDGSHVAFGVPGDILEGGTLIAGVNHVVPPCRHFPRCGGCQLQHVADDAYAEYLSARVRDALAAHGLHDVAIAIPHLSPPRARRRTTLHAERRGKRIAIGFNEARSHAIVDMAECHVLRPELFALVAPLRVLLVPLLRGRARVTLALTDQGVDIGLAGIEVGDLASAESLTAFGERYRVARLSVDEGFGPAPRYAPLPVTLTLSGVAVPFPENSFAQATVDGERALVDSVRAIVGEAVAVDLFAGLGTFALALPGPVHAVEGARDAVLSLAATRRVTTEHRDLFRRPLASSELDQFEAAVLDPPRVGAAEQIAQLAASRLAKIAYVSCNPATFARDAAVLVRAGWHLDRVRPVGQFRWSTHVELVAGFSR